MVLNLPCKECVTKECEKKISCRHVNSLLGTGKAWPKRRTYSIDLRHIEESTDPLNKFQREILNTIANFSLEIKEQLAEQFSIKEAIEESLTDREKQVIQFLVEGYKQEEIARELGVSQQRVSRLLKSARNKLKNFLERGC